MKTLFPMAILIQSLTISWTSLNAETPQDYGAPNAGQVRIDRDTYGVPHIIAQDNRSLFFGVGYAQAEDQLENLAMNYLRGKGRAAEQEGVYAERQFKPAWLFPDEVKTNSKSGLILQADK